MYLTLNLKFQLESEIQKFKLWSIFPAMITTFGYLRKDLKNRAISLGFVSPHSQYNNFVAWTANWLKMKLIKNSTFCLNTIKMPYYTFTMVSQTHFVNKIHIICHYAVLMSVLWQQCSNKSWGHLLESLRTTNKIL